MRILPILSAIVLAGVAAALPGDPCPNERASNVEARSVDVGEKERCGVGVVILGQDISFFGPSCYDFVFLYPAYQECKGEALSGYQCVPEANLGVRVWKCECSSLSIPLLETGIAMPDCDCVDIGEIGHVEDFQTLPCQ